MPLPFLQARAKRRDEVIAIDLGGRHTKAVHVQHKGDQFTLAGFAIVDSPNEQSGTSTEVMAEHLRTVMRALGEKTKTIVVSLNVNDTVVRRAEMPPMPVDDMRQLLKLNSKSYLQQDFPDHVFDCSVVIPKTSEEKKDKDNAKPALNQKLKLVVGGAKRKVVEDIDAAIRAAGLLAAQVSPGLLGPVNAFENSEPQAFSNGALALVDVGFRNTTISMLRNGELMMHRVVNMGGDRITAGLAEAMGISYAEAEGIKVGMPGEIQSTIEPLISSLGRELRAFIDFFEHQEDLAVAEVYISGGSARSEVLVQSLQLELLVPCRIWNPAKTFTLALSPEQAAQFESTAPQLAVAVGAAISAI